MHSFCLSASYLCKTLYIKRPNLLSYFFDLSKPAWKNTCPFWGILFVFCHMSWYTLRHIVNRWERETLNVNSMCPVLAHHNTDHSAGRKASCSGRALIFQVGLIKNSTGRERDGGDLPWPVSDTEKTKKKSLITFQSGSQPSVDYTSLATKLVLMWNHFSPGAWAGTCMAAGKGSLRHFRQDYDTACGGNVCILVDSLRISVGKI